MQKYKCYLKSYQKEGMCVNATDGPVSLQYFVPDARMHVLEEGQLAYNNAPESIESAILIPYIFAMKIISLGQAMSLLYG